MVGARLSPANGGKRPSKSSLLLSASPSKRRKVRSRASHEGTESMESGTNSGPSEMGSETTQTSMARPHVPPTLGMQLEASQNSHLPITASHISISKTECSDISHEIGENNRPCPVVDDRQETTAIYISQDNDAGYKLSGALHGRNNIRKHRVSENKKISCTSEMIHVNWLHLPPLVVWQVWRSLCNDSDRIKMRLVSSEWYKELPKLMAPRPWVIGSKMEDGIFHCINRNSLQELKFKCEVPDGCFSGSSRDFLISEANLGCSLWNPSDGMVVPLPLKSYIKIVTLEISDPLAFAHSSGKVRFSYGRPTEQGSWKNIVCFDKSIKDICQCGKEFYAVNGLFRLYKLDQENGKMVMVGPEQRSDDIRKLLADGRDPDHVLLADMNDELLVIALGRNLQSVQLFKVAWIDEQTASLVMIDDLGGWSIFLGRNQSIALNAMDFPGIDGNNLYIALEPLLDVRQTVQVYCLQTRTVVYADYPSDKLGIPFFYHPGCVSTCE